MFKTNLIALSTLTFAGLCLAAPPATDSPDSPSPAARLSETVSTTTQSDLAEDAPVGETNRPEWTSSRRFPSTRVYIQQEPWEVGVESWWRYKHHRDGTVENRLLEEVEMGLPYRMQLDLYTDIEGDQDRNFHFQTCNIELRWALADWGVLWGNPTLYGEFKFPDSRWGAHVYELKALFGDDFAKRWHWAVNAVWEAETGGSREYEFQVPGGLSYSVIDKRFGLGFEFLYDHDTVRGQRGNPENQFNIGPSIQYRPTDKLHIDLSCMFGANEVSDRQITWVVVGYDFGGPTGHDERTFTPTGGLRN